MKEIKYETNKKSSHLTIAALRNEKINSLGVYFGEMQGYRNHHLMLVHLEGLFDCESVEQIEDYEGQIFGRDCSYQILEKVLQVAHSILQKNQ